VQQNVVRKAALGEMERPRQLMLLLAVLLLTCAAGSLAHFSAATLPGLKVSLSQGGT
jgi:hypothetical protein